MKNLVLILCFLSATASFATFSQVGRSGQNEKQEDPAARAPLLPQDADGLSAEGLQQQQLKVGEQMNALNQINPLSKDATLDKIDPSKLPEKMQWIGNILTNPMVQDNSKRIMQLVQDGAFQQAATAIIGNPNLKWLYVGLGLVTLFTILIKKRALAASDRWWTRILVRLSVFCLFCFSVFLVSYLVLGQPFIDVFWTIKKTWV